MAVNVEKNFEVNEYKYLSKEDMQRLSVLKHMVSTYYGFQKARIAMDNRLAGMIKEYVDFNEIAEKVKSNGEEKEIEEFQKRFNIPVSKEKGELVKKMKKASLPNLSWLIEKYTGMTEVSQLAHIVWESESIERKLKRDIGKSLGSYEIYNKWMRYVKGMGPVLSAAVISVIKTPKRFKNISALWQFSGLGHIYYCIHCNKHITVNKVMSVGGKKKKVRTFGGRLAAEAHAKGHGLKYDDCIVEMAQKRVTGITANWNPFMKTTCWKIASSFVNNGKYYRRAYEIFKYDELEKAEQPQLKRLEVAIGWVPVDDEIREKIMKRFQCPECGYTEDKPLRACPMCGMRAQPVITAERAEMLKKMGVEEVQVVPMRAHIDNRAKRKTVKLFLSHLYDRWMRLEGEDPGEPYASKILGHNFYPPPEPEGGVI